MFCFENYFAGFLDLNYVHFDYNIIAIAVTEANIWALMYFWRPFWENAHISDMTRIQLLPLDKYLSMVLTNFYAFAS